MKIDIITMWYNEAFLAPFFLNHYSYADTIHILYDKETTDNTLEIISRSDNVNIIPVQFPDMLDDLLKVQTIHATYRSLDADWVIVVDSDEFVFPLPLGTTMHEFLQKESKFNLFNAHMWQVYRHRTDADLNNELPPVPQRRHGDPDTTHGNNAYYIKPIVVRSGLDVEWDAGCHVIRKKNKKEKIRDLVTGRWFFEKRPLLSPERVYGAHWAMADPAIALQRRITRRERLSKRNLETGMGLHNFDITTEKIIAECNSHLDDPVLF